MRKLRHGGGGNGDLGQYRTFAKKYHLIDDEAQRSIIVPYRSERTGKDSTILIRELEWRSDYELMRKLQRFTVTVPERIYADMWKNGLLRTVGEGKHVTLSNPDCYKPGIGLAFEDEMYKEILII